MPRYYRRRYTRVVRPKKKWASCITRWNGESVTGPYVTTLASNSVQSGTPTPSILKVGNFKITVDLVAKFSQTQTMNLMAIVYILFVPEGIQDSEVYNLPTQHPEYIMATKVAGGSFQSGTVLSLDTVNMSTRLKRNLNSGDKIVMYMEFAVGTDLPSTVGLTGNVRYWCCSN